MANIGKWTTTVLATIMSTELNSLANNTMAFTAGNTGPYDNSTGLNIYCDIEIFLASLSPATASYVSLYLFESVDGTNFPAPSAADCRSTTSQLLGIATTGVAAATAQRLIIRNVVLPPAKMNFAFDNQTGVSLNASGNTIKILTYNANLNG